MKNRVAFHTLGCKLNFTETSAIGRQFRDNGFTKVNFDDPSDVYVINTCSVTENADKECRKLVSKALQKSPDAFVAIVGCYAQLKPNEIAEIPGVDLVLGANEKFNIVNYIEDLHKNEKALVKACEIDDVNTFVDAQSEHERTRVFLKVQDGCDYSCTFCTIPLARGKSRSDTLTNVVSRAQLAIAGGAKEIILTGVNLGDFGILDVASGKHEATFLDLVEMLDQMDDDVRIRISSIEPNLLDEEIIDLVAVSKKFMPHFHIPLQSGSDKILKMMRRRYLTNLYSKRIAYIKNKIPNCCIGVDVIVGFPGETEEDFLQTYNYLNGLDISYLHVFTYSERDNTPAAEMKQEVPMAERKKRNKMLRILSEKKLRNFYNQHLGKTYNVLFESDNKSGFMHGFTSNYIKVKTNYNNALINQVHACKLIDIDTDGDVKIQFQQIAITQ
jgi:threonylcarbamoyladenosine tRNA methylthiotransferase MtaB